MNRLDNDDSAPQRKSDLQTLSVVLAALVVVFISVRIIGIEYWLGVPTKSNPADTPLADTPLADTPLADTPLADAPSNEPQSPRFTDLDGIEQTPLKQADKKATVFFFLLTDCPISNYYAPEIQRIYQDYEAKNISFFVVHADPDVTAEQAKKHAQDFGLPCPVLRDPNQVLVEKTGVSMAPEAAVLSPDGKVLYRGRIDDSYIDYGKRRPQPTKRDLRNALDAVLQGQAVETQSTKVVGCFLPEPKK